MATSPTLDLTMQPRELTLIVAATNKMGIGNAGTLPWTGLKKEMAYFARITKRAAPNKTNAVIMGRKTWDSIPPKFRPLKDRLNMVITTRAPQQQSEQASCTMSGSLASATQLLTANGAVDRAFVIGGGQIYKAALELAETRRILLTRVLGEFECDTEFPVVLGDEGRVGEWERRSKEDLDSWTGEVVPDGVQEENGIRYVFEMWERR